MSASLDGFDVNSMNSWAAMGESDKGVNDRMVDGSRNKTLIENSDDKGNFTDGFRVLNEANVLTGERNMIDESLDSGLNGKEFGDMDDKNYGSKSRVVEMMSRDDGLGMMNRVGRLLEGKFGVDGDEDRSENRPGINLVVDLNPWRDTVGDPTSENGICINGNAINKDTYLVNSGCQREVTVLRGEQDSMANELVPDGDSETKEVNNDETDVLMTEGYGKQDSVTNELLPGGKSKIEEVNNAKTDVLMMEGYGKQDSVINELFPGGKSEVEEMDNAEDDVLMSEGHGEQFVSEKHDAYYVSDLVWGKVRSHPWWPGQIFAPSAASAKALKYFKNDSYLIAYFGDRTFAWNEGSKIKPFLMNFSEMENQSNTEGFLHAVSCALDEVSRRVEVGLSCPCLPKEVRNKIETQVVVNAGIREESNKRIGGGRFFTAADTFLPDVLVDFVELVAKDPSFEIDTLQVSVMKAQLVGFNRWRGRYHVPSFEEFGELVEDVVQFNAKGERSDYEEVDEVRSKKRKSYARPSFDENLPDKKKKCISSLMPSIKSSEMAQSSGAGKSQKGEIMSTNSLNSDEILSKLRLAARNPRQFRAIMGPAADLLLEHRSWVYEKKSLLLKSHLGNKMKQSSSNMETADEFVFEGMEDSYWTDRVIQSCSQLEEHGNETTGDYSPTALILKFENLESIPSVTNLNEIFRRFGPLTESETKILSESKRAKVIFEKPADAEAAFSSTGKYSTFGPSLVSYTLNYAPTPRKAGGTSKRNKKPHT